MKKSINYEIAKDMAVLLRELRDVLIPRLIGVATTVTVHAIGFQCHCPIQQPQGFLAHIQPAAIIPRRIYFRNPAPVRTGSTR